MKRLIISLCFIISLVMCGGLIAQNNDKNVEKVNVNNLSQQNSDSNMQQWKNFIEPFVGVWSLEKTSVDDQEENSTPNSCTFMIINPDAAYTIFVYIDRNAFITSQGVILVDSSDEYIEVISEHMNNSLIGVSNRIDYKLDLNYLHKSFWIEKDRHGGDYKRQVNETWKRAKMPAASEYEDNPAFPI